MTDEPPSEERADPASTDEEVLELGGRVAQHLLLGRPVLELTPWEQLELDDFRQDIELRKRYARVLLLGLGAQLLVASVIFVVYASMGAQWKIPATTMDVWLGTTVVQVVGIVLVVTRNLFPSRSSRRG